MRDEAVIVPEFLLVHDSVVCAVVKGEEPRNAMELGTVANQQTQFSEEARLSPDNFVQVVNHDHETVCPRCSRLQKLVEFGQSAPLSSRPFPDSAKQEV